MSDICKLCDGHDYKSLEMAAKEGLKTRTIMRSVRIKETPPATDGVPKYPVTEEGRPIFGEGSAWCIKSYLAGVATPKYTREELVEKMCRANSDLSSVGSDALVYLSMDDCATGIQSPNWHRHIHTMHNAINALIEAGALTVKE